MSTDQLDFAPQERPRGFFLRNTPAVLPFTALMLDPNITTTPAIELIDRDDDNVLCFTSVLLSNRHPLRSNSKL